MVNQNLDEYVTKFEKLSQQAGYSTLMDTDLVLDLFTSGIPEHCMKQPTLLIAHAPLTSGNAR